MTNKEIFEIALNQSAIECRCNPDDFLKSENVVTLSQKDERARKYLPLPFECNMVSYGSNVVATTSERLFDTAKKYVKLLKNITVFIDKICFLVYDVVCISDSGGSLPIFGK